MFFINVLYLGLKCNYASLKVQTKFYTTNVYQAYDVAGAGTISNGLILFNIKPSSLNWPTAFLEGQKNYL